MPITQFRMMAILDGWRAQRDATKDFITDFQDLYTKYRESDPGLALDELFSKLPRLKQLPEHSELLASELMHFKHAQYRNNYQQRAAARRRGKPGNGERYSPDTITPPAQFTMPQPSQLQSGQSSPSDAAKIDDIIQADSSYMQTPEPLRTPPPTAAKIKPIVPPDPDTKAESIKDASSFDDL